jgi:hypothetical protein
MAGQSYQWGEVWEELQYETTSRRGEPLNKRENAMLFSPSLLQNLRFPHPLLQGEGHQFHERCLGIRSPRVELGLCYMRQAGKPHEFSVSPDVMPFVQSHPQLNLQVCTQPVFASPPTLEEASLSTALLPSNEAYNAVLHVCQKFKGYENGPSSATSIPPATLSVVHGLSHAHWKHMFFYHSEMRGTSLDLWRILLGVGRDEDQENTGNMVDIGCRRLQRLVEVCPTQGLADFVVVDLLPHLAGREWVSIAAGPAEASLGILIQTVLTHSSLSQLPLPTFTQWVEALCKFQLPAQSTTACTFNQCGPLLRLQMELVMAYARLQEQKIQ